VCTIHIAPLQLQWHQDAYLLPLLRHSFLIGGRLCTGFSAHLLSSALKAVACLWRCLLMSQQPRLFAQCAARLACQCSS
jgi:hypothetical protein